MIKVILWDIDGTLLDFLVAEKIALQNCFRSHDMGECTDEMIERYSVINRKYWEKLERNEITKPEVLIGRFKEFFGSEGLPVEKAESFNDEYQIRLGDTCVFCEGAQEVIDEFTRRGYRQYIVTNGTEIAQKRKMKNSGLDKIVEKAFISDEIGIEKPMIGFFDKVFETIGDYKKDEIIIIGDSLTSDMRGGNNAGILCCWYNPKGQKNETDVKIDYEISSLKELINILE